MESKTSSTKIFQNLEFDIKIYDRDAGFKKRGADPANKERKAITKRTGLSLLELDEVVAAIKSKY